MDRLLSLSRAARLVGITRGALQKIIREGGLTSFEGMVRLADLTTLFPDTRVEDTAMLEKVERIIEHAAIKARNRPKFLPDTETLAARVNLLSSELAQAKLELSNYVILLEKLKSKFASTSKQADADTRAALDQLIAWIEKEFAKLPAQNIQQEQLLAEDNLLRILAAQVHIRPSGHEFFVEGSSSILESGLSAGLALNYGCSNGNCGKCKARLVSGKVRKIRPHDYVLSASEKSQGYILACCNTAMTDVILDAEEAGTENDIPIQNITARVKKLEYPHQDILILTIRTPRTQRLRFMAGQNLILGIDDKTTGDYPIASCPCDEMNIQFHIPRATGDSFAEYAYERLKVSDPILLEGPKGHFVLSEDSNRPILFLAYDTDFAPIKSLIEHAITVEKAEYIHLYWICPQEHGHYLHNQCRAWTDALDSFLYTPLVANLSAQNSEHEAAMQNILNKLTEDHVALDAHDVYISGPQNLIAYTKKFLTERGFPTERFYSSIATTA